ncbi:mucin-2 [Streptomyces sp. NPDC048565]|uniref:PP2C family protein-serine/threonine phosphatase n=1 Tax=Streptomyces sp. NPDC048565 TaxID=3155266 RepID=UPI0034432AD7
MRTHASAQLIGGRSHQCDATATYTVGGSRAYALLDGIGSNDAVRDWTRTYARRLARAAARSGAETGLRIVHAVAAAENRDDWDFPAAVAVVAVAAPGEPLKIAWCGDSRAYIATPDGTRCLTKDHNMRQVLLDMGHEPGRYSRNQVTSYLGDPTTDPAIGSVTAPHAGRLALLSDGAYEPIEDAGKDVGTYLTGGPQRAATLLTTAAINHASDRADNATALVVDFLG